MDFFDEITTAVSQDGARRGIRVSPEDWQRFISNVPKTAVQNVPAEAAEIRPAESTQYFNQVDDAAETLAADAPAAPAPIMSAQAVPQDWDALQSAVQNCRNCPLCNTRQNSVFGEGARNARLMFIGEAPGAEEDATGRPFVGAAGQLLDKMINAMHLSREEVYIGNIVKCRPPGNRMPGEEEAAACIGYLEQQIKLIQPEVIVLLGGTALHFLLKIDGISRCRGRWFEYNNIAVMPTFHPAFLLRKAEAKREAWHDLKLVMARLNIQV